MVVYNTPVIQIYGRKKCAGTRKAERFFKERRIPVQSVDVDVKPPGRRELELFVTALGPEAVVDTSGKAFRDRGLAYMEYDAAEELAGHPELLRTPVVRSGRQVVCGVDEGGWTALAEAAAGEGA